MREETFRQIVLSEAGEQDLLPSGVKDPELLLKALVRKWLDDRKADQGKIRFAEYTSQQKVLDCQAMKRNMEECEQATKHMTHQLSSAKREVGMYEAKIAFLGNHWEELTGEVNKMIHKDPNTAARQCKGEMEATKTLLFDTELKLKMQQKKVDTLEARCKEQDEMIARWSADVISTSERSTELEAKNIKLQDEAREMSETLKKTLRDLEERELDVRELKGKLSVSDLRLKDTTSRAEQLNVRVVKVGRDLMAKESTLDESKVLVQRSAGDRLDLHTQVGELKASLQVEKQALADTKQLLKASEDEVKTTTDQLKLKIAELNNLSIEFSGAKVVNNRLTKDVNRSEKKMKEEKTEVEALRSGLDTTAAELIAVRQRLQVSEAEAERLAKELAAKKQQHETAEARASSIDAQGQATAGRLTATTAEHRQLQVVTNRLEKDLRISQQETRGAGDRIEQMRLSLERSAGEIKSLTEQLESSQAETRRFREELAAVQHQLGAAEASVSQLEGCYKRASADLNISMQNLNTAGSAVNTLTKDVRARSKEVDKYESEVATARAQIATLAGQLAASEERVQNEQALRKETAAKAEHERELRVAAEDGIKIVTASNDRLVFEMDIARKQKDIESNKGRQIEREAAGREAVIASKDLDVSAIRGQYESLSAQFHKATDELKASVEERRCLTDELEGLKKRLEVSEGLAADRERIYNRTVGELELARQDYACIGAQTKDLSKRVKAKESVVGGLESEVSSYKGSLESVTDRLQQSEGRFAGLNERIRVLEDQLRVSKRETVVAQGKITDAERSAETVVCELESSQVKLRESDVLIRKMSQEMRGVRERLQDAETERTILGNNVSRLMEEFRKVNGVK